MTLLNSHLMGLLRTCIAILTLNCFKICDYTNLIQRMSQKEEEEEEGEKEEEERERGGEG